MDWSTNLPSMDFLTLPSEAAPTSTAAVASPRQRRGPAVRRSAGGVASCGGLQLTTASRKNTPPSARCHSNVRQMKYNEKSAISRATVPQI